MIDMVVLTHWEELIPRVIIDEAEMVGLRGDVKVTTRQDVREIGAERIYNYTVNLRVTGSEWPPKV